MGILKGTLVRANFTFTSAQSHASIHEVVVPDMYRKALNPQCASVPVGLCPVIMTLMNYRSARDMTQSREVLAMMDAHTTTFGRTRGCTISRCGAFLLGALFLLSIVVTALLVYHLAPCAGRDSAGNDSGNLGLRIGSGFLGAGNLAKKLDVRLPRSVVPVLYQLKLTPFIWEGNFTFNGEVGFDVDGTSMMRNLVDRPVSILHIYHNSGTNRCQRHRGYEEHHASCRRHEDRRGLNEGADAPIR